MRKNTRRHTISTLRAGQPRPYADSEYEYEIKFEIVKEEDGEFELEDVPDACALMRCKGMPGIGTFKIDEDKPEWHDTQVRSFIRTGVGQFKLILRAAYTG